MSSHEVSGPLALLNEAERADEVLILTYTASLEFFEGLVLSQVGGLQAAATVVADSAMVAADPGSVRWAGLRYLDARAAVPGGRAFHPKLLVIAGRERATVAVGSGNLTLAGWHANEELWTVLRSADGRGPTTLRDVSAFLRALSDSPVALSDEAPAALRQVAEILDGLPANDPGPALASSLSSPIAEALPSGPVDDLAVYAPFHDRALAGLTAVCDRLAPERLTVFVQPQTSVDGPRLQDFLNDRGGELAWCTDDSYRHGKLIEWTVGGELYALTGSPNLSGRALLETATGAGNVELALIGRAPAYLRPEAIPAPVDGASLLKWKHDPADRPSTGPVLLSAVLQAAAPQVRLRMAGALTGPAAVQFHDDLYDWIDVAGAQVPVGVTEHLVPSLGLQAGRAVRLLSAEGPSNEVFVLDPGRARARPVKRTGSSHGTISEQFWDGRLDALYEDAEALAAELGKQSLPAGEPTQRTDGNTGTSPSRAAPPTLADYYAACASVVEDATIDWALALPAMPGLGRESLGEERGLLTTDTAGEDGEPGPGEDGDRLAGDAAADVEVTDWYPTSPSDLQEAIRKASAHRRRQMRTFCERAVAQARNWPPPMRCLTARLVLHGVAAGLWPEHEHQEDVLAAVVRALGAPADESPAEVRAAAASYAAVALRILREDVVRLSVRDEANLRFQGAASAARGLLDDVDPAILDLLAEELADELGGAVAPDRVFDLARDVQSPQTGAASAVRLLADDYGLRADVRADGSIELADPLAPGRPERELLLAVGLTGGDGPVVVRGTCSGRACICVWKSPLLLVERERPTGTGGSLYELPHGPRTVALSWKPTMFTRDVLGRPTEHWLPGQPRTPRALETRAAAGIDDS